MTLSTAGWVAAAGLTTIKSLSSIATGYSSYQVIFYSLVWKRSSRADLEQHISAAADKWERAGQGWCPAGEASGQVVVEPFEYRVVKPRQERPECLEGLAQLARRSGAQVDMPDLATGAHLLAVPMELGFGNRQPAIV